MSRWISIVLLIIGAINAAGSIAGCSQRDADDSKKGGHMREKTIEQVQEEHTNEWMAVPGVVGTAIGLFDGKPCIKVFTSSRPQQIRAKIPSSIDGYLVIIEETGEFRALEQQ